MIDNDIKKQIEQNWNRNDEELYYDIGMGLYGHPAFPPSLQEILEECKNWLDIMKPEFAKKLCGNPNIQMLDSQDANVRDNIELATIVAEAIILCLTNFSVPVAHVAIILVRKGIRHLCDEEKL